jgi:hypothetical protein
LRFQKWFDVDILALLCIGQSFGYFSKNWAIFPIFWSPYL